MKKINKSVIIFTLILTFTLVGVPMIEILIFNFFIENYYWNHYRFQYGTIWILFGLIPLYFFYKLNIEILENKKIKINSEIYIDMFFRLIFFIIVGGLIFFLGLFSGFLFNNLYILSVSIPIVSVVFLINYYISKFFINKILTFSNNKISKKILWGIIFLFIAASFILGDGVTFNISH